MVTNIVEGEITRKELPMVVSQTGLDIHSKLILLLWAFLWSKVQEQSLLLRCA